MACDANVPECTAEQGVTAPPEVLEVTGARLGLLFSPVWSNERESAYLAPAWVYDVAGRDYPEAVIAVAAEYLAEVAPQPDHGEPLVDPAPPETRVDPAPPAPDAPAPQPERTTEATPEPAYS